MPEDKRWYEVQKQEWDAQGVEPVGPFTTVYEGSELTQQLKVASGSSGLVRARAITQADMQGAVPIPSKWTFATLFRQPGVCPPARRLLETSQSTVDGARQRRLRKGNRNLHVSAALAGMENGMVFAFSASMVLALLALATVACWMTGATSIKEQDQDVQLIELPY